MKRLELLIAGMAVSGALLMGVSPAEARQFPPGTGQTVTRDTLMIDLAEARRRALAENPAHLADQQELDLARARTAGARVWGANPELEFLTPGVREHVGVGEFELSLSQEVEIAGQRGLRIAAARSGEAGAAAFVADATRRMLAEVSDVWYVALAAYQRLAVVQEIARLNDDLVRATRIQMAEGQISVLDSNLAEIEAGRARAAVFAMEREHGTAMIELAKLLGLPPEQPIRLSDDLTDNPSAAVLDVDSLVAIAIGRRPDLAARSRELEQAESLGRLSRREAVPNPRFQVFIERKELEILAGGNGGDPAAPRQGALLQEPRFGVGVSVPVPLFQRNQGTIAESGARVDQARFARQAAEATVRADVVNAWQALRTASHEHRIFEEQVLEPARTNQRLLDTAFNAGKVGLPTLILLRNQLLDAELGHWDAWLAEHRAQNALDAATAELSGAAVSDSSLVAPRRVP